MGETVEALVSGGKATPAPPLGPTLSQMKINVGEVIKQINEKTKNFSGMDVPVKVKINDDKSFDITVGTPPVSSLIKNELKLEKGSQHTGKEDVADIHIEQVIKIAKMKEDGMQGNLKNKVKQIIGTCNSMGILVEEKHPKEAMKMVEEGKFDKEINSGKTELSKEELKEVEEEKKKLGEELQKKKEAEKQKAKEIASQLKDRIKLKHALEEEGISKEVIQETLDEFEKGAAIAKKE